MSTLRRALAVPPFTDDPAGVIGLGVAAEQAGFDGFFLWDHLVFADTGQGPPILDPWQILAVVATQTSRIRLGTMITPVPRRRPWQLAKETVTLDRLSGGRVILGVGLGSPPYADFGIFHEPTANRERAALLDEGLQVLAGLWTGERFTHQGRYFTVDPVRFSPAPVQQPRIPVWVGGVLPAAGPVRRACRWDGMVPLHGSPRPDGGMSLTGPTPADIAAVRDQAWSSRGTPEGFDLVVWADLEQEPGDVELVAPAYTAAGATWWIETAHPGPGGQAEAARRVSRGL
ncbi:MAG TPA: LLM class flavin-dependent oxidoreductase [Streptosporangiaceae bacterium]